MKVGNLAMRLPLFPSFLVCTVNFCDGNNYTAEDDFVELSLIYKTSGFHGGDYEEWRLLGSYAVWLL
jgi:hypothetical protein